MEKVSSTSPPLKIIHFNDVYDICEKNSHHCGGVARFAGAMFQHKEKDPDVVILFSGDLWSPSKRNLLISSGINLLSNQHVSGIANCQAYQRMLD